MTIKAQDANVSGPSGLTANPGGNIILTPGSSTGTASKGVVTLNSVLNVVAGTATSSVNGMNTSITAENAGAGNQNGGNINLTPGTATGSGVAGNVIVNGKLKIVDGTQSLNKVLTSDANGLTSWANPLPSAQYGTLANSSNQQSISLLGNGSTTDTYLNSYITLPEGKWDVNLSILSSPNGTATTGSWWVRMGLSTSNTSFTTNSSDFPINTLVSGRVNAVNYEMIQGHIIINNTSGSAKTYYLWTGQCDLNGVDGSSTLRNISSSVYGENLIFATPIY